MKKVIGILTLVIAVIGFTAAADAAIVNFTDSVDMGMPGPIGLHMDSGNFLGVSSKTWTFDITDDGFVPGEYDVLSATVDLHFSEYDCDNDIYIGRIRIARGAPEWAQLTAGGDVVDTWEVDTGWATYSGISTVSLQSDGLLNCKLDATSGDFWFNQANLSVDAEAVSQPVPEPASMLMFGVGLVGLFLKKRMF